MAEVPLPTPTQVPVPSTDIRNAVFAGAKLDEEVTGTGEFYTDRLGVKRLTNTGRNNQFNVAQQERESRFDAFIQSSGYEVIGDYTAGPLTLTEYNQLIRYNNELYKLTAATDIPFTTAGNTDETWASSDAAHFVSVGDAALRQSLASGAVGVVSVDYVHLINGPSVTMEYFIATSATMNDAFIAACASGKTVLLRSDVTYQVSRNDFPVARGTNLIATGGSYATIEVLSPFGDYGLFDMSTENGLDGGRYNIFYGLKFRYPNQVRIIDGTVIVKPVEYPPVFHGGAFESRFINLDMGNAYMAFRLGGAMNGRDLGSASRIVIDNIIGAPIYRGLSLEQVLDVPVIQNIRWNYNYLAGTQYAYDQTLKQWIHDNMWPYIFGRIDWATIKNIFSYGGLRGITTLSSRFTGSADRLKFIGCHFDHTVFPLYLQNFSSRIDFSLCHFVGDKDSNFTRIAPNVCFINNVGDSNAVVGFETCTFYNFTSTVLRTDGTRIELRGGSISKFGFDSQADRIRNGIELLSPTTIKIVGTRIDASSGTHTRCVFDGEQGNSTLYIGDGSELIGATYESYRWDGGVTGGNKEYISREAVIEGATTAVNARGVHSFYQQKYVYPSTSMPTTGSFKAGDEVTNMFKQIQGVAGSRYVITGWLRVTTGSSHVLNVDWVAQKVPTGD
ncbi:hypothetical protein [Klebsiella pneumoniae]|uniref:hypothetical protein n=1 Tax=Klebsiella pneumoniae TaxID=573 RepID=UPI001F30E464|nr:hypothetical protein [Klebsiella pneumoniae]EKX4116080.1 hypothetical protein [Klebsiella pneumoniae]MCE7334004.1 hypothetical protein [Klebsiella pneumoniae]